MNVEIGTEAALFPGKEYITGIFVAVCQAVVLLTESGQLVELSGDLGFIFVEYFFIF
jgi:hypothetical protein